MSGLWSQEWRLFSATRANVLLLAILLLLSVLGAWNGVQRLKVERAAAAEAIAADRAYYAGRRAALVELEAGRTSEGQFGSARKAHQVVLGEASARPLIPPRAELAALSSAEARPTPDLLRIGTLTRHRDEQPTLDDPSNRLDGPFDLAFVATWLAPLFALVLAFDVLAKDREQGISPLLASQGRSLRSVAAVRLGIRFIVLFAVVGGVAAASVLLSEAKQFATALPALIVWLSALALSLAFWLGLAGLVNASARSAASASVALLAIWIGLSMLTPAAIGAAVNAIAPPPDRLQTVLDLRDLESDLNRRRAEVTAAYYATHPQNRPVRQGDEYEQYFVTELYPRTLAFDRAFAPIAARQDEARVRQAQAMRLASLFSPSLAFKLMTEDLAGGAPERRRAFLQSADAFQARWRGHFGDKLASMRPLTLPDFDAKPEFKAVAEPARRRWARIGLLLALLAAPAALAVAAAHRALGRASPL